MTIDFYYVPGSAPCRAARLVAAEVGVELNLKLTNLMAGEHLTPEFLKMNPQHTLPTIDDKELYLWESRAIMGYLVSQYGQTDTLYPKDPRNRALVDQRLYFDLNTLYQAFIDYYYPQIFSGLPEDSSKYDKIKQAFDLLNEFLEGKNYVAGKHRTIADISLLTTVSNYELLGYDIGKHDNVSRWYAKVKGETTKYEEINGEGLKAFKGLIDSLSKKG